MPTIQTADALKNSIEGYAIYIAAAYERKTSVYAAIALYTDGCYLYLYRPIIVYGGSSAA
jgi:hypothetical protein